ncbi:CAZyme family GT69 [Penicillium paradoxum]|uniref:CAZyme family GT69 n=1 Tax=Penicillium paradoxum TaxID=176176 RepID=UPI002548D90C|nr:CAZyme family GT69 [Penicillium paradoxum]KAJ5794618.1 CAZyme family GT69 [Penicillium paradoxum]
MADRADNFYSPLTDDHWYFPIEKYATLGVYRSLDCLDVFPSNVYGVISSNRGFSQTYVASCSEDPTARLWIGLKLTPNPPAPPPPMTLLSTSRRGLRYRIARALIILSIIWTLAELHLIQRRVYEVEHSIPKDRPQKQERIYIASVHWNNELILRSHWNKAVLELVSKLGPDNVFISIFESGSYDNTKGALTELDWELERMQVPRNITLSPVTHEDEIAAPAQGDGWIQTPSGNKELRRVPYLARIRNLSLLPLRDLARKGITFDKILFLNDVVFTPSDVFELLDTNHGEYGAACSLDFSKPPDYYDTFALRDIQGHEPIMQTWPYFSSAVSRHAMKNMAPVPVTSCWNGMGMAICSVSALQNLTFSSGNACKPIHRQ